MQRIVLDHQQQLILVLYRSSENIIPLFAIKCVSTSRVLYSTSISIQHTATLSICWVKVLCPTWHKIGVLEMFFQVIHLASYWKNTRWRHQKQTTQKQNGTN